MFLNSEQLEQLTGYKYQSKQVEFLRKQGFQFTVDRFGRPCLPIAAIEAINGNVTGSRKGPNIDALRKRLDQSKHKRAKHDTCTA